MQLSEYQASALRTESKIDEVITNKKTLSDTLDTFECVTEILDLFKKNIYYNKPIAQGRYEDLVAELKDLVTELEVGSVTNDKTTLDLNPRVLHGVLGIATESGELVSALNKHFYEGTIDAVNIQEEVVDGNWYSAILHDELKLDWGTGLQNNIDKLKARFPDKFTSEKAINRDLETERKELEKV